MTNEILNVPIKLIKPEAVPLKQEKMLKNSLIDDGQKQKQWQPITLREIDEPPFRYEYVNGRRRTETIRAVNEEETVLAIIDNVDDKDLHIGALIGNSGRPNYADEAEHVYYLHIKQKMPLKEIARQTNMEIQRVRDRLRTKLDTSSPVFEALKNGNVNYTTVAYLRKLPKVKQTRILKNNIEKGKKVTTKIAEEEVRKNQAKEINNLFNMFDNEGAAQKEPQQIILTSQMMENIIKDEVVEVVWNNQKIMICRCE